MAFRRFSITEAFIVIAIVLILVFVLFRGTCVNENRAIDAAEDQGWSQVEIKSDHWFLVGFRGCDDKDAAAFKASALNPRGDHADIVICCGAFFKGCTIRSD